MGLREDVDLHVAIQTIPSLVVYANAQTRIADQSIKPVQLFCQRLGYFIDLLEVFEIALSPLHFAYVTPFLERFLSFVGVLFLVRQEIDFRGIMLKEVRDDAVSDSSGAACYDIYLKEALETCTCRRRDKLTFPLRSGMSVLGSKALPIAFLMVSMML